MSAPPSLTDRSALARNRARATAPFLQETARDEAEHRLGLVNRTFQDAAVVTGHPASWAGFEATVIADDPVLDLHEGAHDLVIHAGCLHWADDPVGQLIQCRRALRPDGLFLGLTYGGRTLHALRAALAEAETALTGGLSPRVLPMADIRDLGALLHRAGFALPVADSQTLSVSYASPLHLMRDLRAMGEGNALAGRLRRPTPRSLLFDAARRYPLSEDGRTPATFELITLTGWSPDASQPQPLRPGSATKSLAEALGTVETPLDD